MKVYYGGAWHQPHGGYAPTFNPATNQPLVDAPIADAIDVDRAVDAASTAFRTWRATTPETRSAALRRVAAIIRDNIPELALMDAANNGNPVSLIAKNLDYGVALVEYFATLALEAKGSTYPGPRHNLRFSVREPYGVCARLVAYNHPTLFLAAKAAPVIATGNCVIMKAPDQAPLSSMLLIELIQAGCIGVNSIAFHSLGSPFGGYKQSGIGREECIEELYEFTQMKTYSVSLGAAN
jgi:betaine-aldehyde dehydrogenase